MRPLERHQTRIQKNLTSKGEIVLDIVGVLGDKTVMDIIECAIENKVATHATAHKELMNLIKERFVILTPSEADRRVKICQLSIKGKRYLETI